jgi:hypothetical protein
MKLPTVSAKMMPSEIDLNDFTNGRKGRILGSILIGFAGRQTFENGQRINLDEWTRLLIRFYELSMYLQPPIVPEFTMYLFDKLDPQSISSIKLLNVIAEWEPLLSRQKVSQKSIEQWSRVLKDNVTKLIDIGTEFEAGDEPQDYDEWHSEVRAVLDATAEFRRWAHIGNLEGFSRLSDLYETVEQPGREENDDGEDYAPGDGDNYWTIERLFEDL